MGIKKCCHRRTARKSIAIPYRHYPATVNGSDLIPLSLSSPRIPVNTLIIIYYNRVVKEILIIFFARVENL